MGSGRFVIGIIMNLCGSIMINTGQNIVKLSHNQAAESEDSLAEVVPNRNWTRDGGWLMFAVGNVLNFSSMAFAPQSTLSALGSIQFVLSPLNAHFLLHEKGALTKNTLIAVGIILIGNTLLILFGSKANRAYDADDLQELWSNSKILLYLLFAAVTLIITYVHANDNLREYLLTKRDMFSPRKLTENKLNTKEQISILKPFAFAYSSAVVGTLSVIFAKSLSELLFSQWPDQWVNWYTYIVILVFPLTATFWMRRMNKGLRDYDAILIIPLLQCNWMVLSIVSGGIYFDEYSEMGGLQYTLFCLGVLIIMSGAVWLGVANFRHHHVEVKSRITAKRRTTMAMITETFEEDDESPMSKIASQRGDYLKACKEGISADELRRRQSMFQKVLNSAAASSVTQRQLLPILMTMRKAIRLVETDRRAAVEALVQQLGACHVPKPEQDSFVLRFASYTTDELKLWLQLEKGECHSDLNEAEGFFRGSLRTMSIFQEPLITSTFEAEKQVRRMATTTSDEPHPSGRPSSIRLTLSPGLTATLAEYPPAVPEAIDIEASV